LPDGFEAQTRRVIENLKCELAGVGSGLDCVVFARVYLTHFQRDYAAVNAVYQFYFVPRHLPARTCISVSFRGNGILAVPLGLEAVDVNFS
jgi:2-iminobutanoate/2-iminopropanoate deaminase